MLLHFHSFIELLMSFVTNDVDVTDMRYAEIHDTEGDSQEIIRISNYDIYDIGLLLESASG